MDAVLVQIFSRTAKRVLPELPIDVHPMVTNPAGVPASRRDADVVTFTTRPGFTLIVLFTLSRIPGAQLAFHVCPGTPVSVLEDLIRALIWCLS